MAMNISADTDAQRKLLQESKVIAVVGYSPDQFRTSYQIANYLKRAGYTVYAVNPTVAEVDGQPSYPSLADVPEPVDIVNVFRRPEYLPGVVDDAIGIGAKAVWAQLGVVHPEAERKAEDACTPIVMNVCIKVAHMRLMR
ncbi:MAG: CoA-binding protein [Anaerolineae bacterium]|nr:CoA-binding protein [Anaerolineae bacterium]